MLYRVTPLNVGDRGYRNQRFQRNHGKLCAQCSQGRHELRVHHTLQRDLLLSARGQHAGT